jgi:colanic acid biosynthesis glycosyl transferase WcaI
MRLLVVVNVFHPDVAGGGTVYTDMCHSLAARGFDVTVRVPYPFYPEWKDKSGRNGFRVWRYVEGEVKVERYGLFIPRNPNSLVQRLLYELTFFCSLLRGVADGRKFDVIMAYSPLAAGVAAAGLMKRLSRRPLWLNVQDISADAAGAAGITGGGVFARLLHRVERALFNQADIWSSISPVMIDRLRQLADRGQRILYLPNWVGLTLRNAIVALGPKRVRTEHGPVRILYAGNIGKKQDLLEFCQTLRRCDAPFEMRIFGSGARAAEVRDWVAETGDPRFRYGPILPEPEFARELNEADLYLITETAGVGGSFIPSKLIPGLLSGTPILAVCDAASPLGCEMREAEPGPRLDWRDLDGIGDLLARLSEDPSPLRRWHERALARGATYDRNAIIDQFDAELRGLAELRGIAGPPAATYCAPSMSRQRTIAHAVDEPT